MPMKLREEGDFSRDTLVVACTAEDMSNGSFTHIKAELISDLAKWGSTLFSSSSDYMTFVGICKLWGTARTGLVFGCAHCIIFFHDAMSCAIFQAKVQSSLSNSLPTKDSTNKQIFFSGRMLMSTSSVCRHESIQYGKMIEKKVTE